MTWRTDLYTALKGLVGNRVYPVMFPQPASGVPVWPAIRFTVVSDVPDLTICGDTADVGVRRLQLDIVASTEPEVTALRSSVMTAMSTFDPPAVNENTFEDFDEATRTFRVVMDYTLHTSG